MDIKQINKKLERVLWIDLEMTGLSPENDLILEVAAIVTDWDFKEIANYHGVIKNNVIAIKKRMALNSIFWGLNFDSMNGLLDQNQIGKPLRKIESELIAFIDKYFKFNTPVLLGGNSIHMDRRFIISKWPKFDARLHYRMLDVSAWKVVFEGKFNKKFMKPDTHRAFNDIRGSIAELQYYLAKFK